MNHEVFKGLNPFSRRLLKALMKLHPEWERYAKIGGIYPRSDPVEDGTLLMRIPRPQGPPCEYLQISTAVWSKGPEVTLEFGGMHTHIDAWNFMDLPPGEMEAAIASKAIEMVEALVTEDLSVSCLVEDGVVQSGVFVNSLEAPTAIWHRFAGRTYRQRSWNGTYDAEGVISNAMIGTKDHIADEQ